MLLIQRGVEPSTVQSDDARRFTMMLVAFVIAAYPPPGSPIE